MVVRVLFVCLGNICRSPLAEGLFKKHLENKGITEKYIVDSCGTSGYHTGASPDTRTCQNALKNGLELAHKARQFSRADFFDYDIILAMDHSNKKNILSMEPALEKNLATVFLMRDFDPQSKGSEVPDPYYGGERGFQEVFHILDRSTAHLLEKLENGSLSLTSIDHS